MAIRTIRQTIDIAAPRERVWDVLLSDETFRRWTAEFMAGSYAETDWRQGSTVRFLDPSGQGLRGRIATSSRPELLDIEYDGLVADGRDDYDSEGARQMKGARETYRLSEHDGRTRLDIAADMGEEYYESMSEAWVRALDKVKSLAESTEA